MNEFAQTLRNELDAVHVVDPHSHLRPNKPEADNLADIVLYHHVWIELVSAGMPITAVTKAGMPHEVANPEMEPQDRLRAALPYLDLISNTTCGNMLRVILRDLYEVPDGRLTASNLNQVIAYVEERNCLPKWEDELLSEKCRIVRSLTVEYDEHGKCSPFVGKGIEGVPVTLQDPRRTPREMLSWVEYQLGREIKCAEDYAEGLRKIGGERSKSDIHFVGIWTLPHLQFVDATERDVTRAVANIRDGRPADNEDFSAIWSFGIRNFLEAMREGPLRTIQLIVGAEVLPPHRSITNWHSNFVGTLGRLAGAFEDFHFSCSSACDAHIQDLAIAAKHIPNVSVAGYWWHVLYPYYIRKNVETRLDIVPANKIVAFFSDAYRAEWIYPKLKLVKRAWAEVLLDRVERDLITRDTALKLVRAVFHDNACAIYGVKSTWN